MKLQGKQRPGMKVRAEGRARFGPIPKRGLPAHTKLCCKVNTAEHKAIREAMAIDGSPNYSQWIVKAILGRLEELEIPVVLTSPTQGTLI
jgi:hypothetical protein